VFRRAVKDYVDQGSKKDCAALSAGDSQLQEFDQLLDTTAAGLRRWTFGLILLIYFFIYL